MTKKQKKMLTRIIICAVMLVALQFLPITGIPRSRSIWPRILSSATTFSKRPARAF